MARAAIVHIPWYATGFRGDDLEAALVEFAPTCLRYGATSYAVHRFHDDRYKFLQTGEFTSKADFERWWHGPEAVDFRIMTSSWYQVPVLYGFADLSASGSIAPEALHTATDLGGSTGDLAG